MTSVRCGPYTYILALPKDKRIFRQNMLRFEKNNDEIPKTCKKFYLGNLTQDTIQKGEEFQRCCFVLQVKKH